MAKTRKPSNRKPPLRHGWALVWSKNPFDLWVSDAKPDYGSKLELVEVEYRILKKKPV